MTYTHTATTPALKMKRNATSFVHAPGENSWYKLKKDLARGSKTYKAERTIPHSFLYELWPHFEALSNEALLKRCEKGYSQKEYTRPYNMYEYV